MKKYSIIALAIILTLSLAACGRRNDTPDTGMTILPNMEPTIDTNIPDPDVDTKMPMYTEGTDTSDWTDSTQGMDATNGQPHSSN